MRKGTKELNGLSNILRDGKIVMGSVHILLAAKLFMACMVLLL